MDWPVALGLVSIFVLVLANGFFVATEFSMVAVRKSRLDELVEEGRMGAIAARDVVTHLDSISPPRSSASRWRRSRSAGLASRRSRSCWSRSSRRFRAVWHP
jgi:hypothetical protein